MSHERFSMVLEATDSDTRPPAIRMRALLKLALRAFGLKCVTVTEVTVPEALTEPENERTGS